MTVFSLKRAGAGSHSSRLDGNTRGYLKQPGSIPAWTGQAVLRLVSKQKQGRNLWSEVAGGVKKVQQLIWWSPHKHDLRGLLEGQLGKEVKG